MVRALIADGVLQREGQSWFRRAEVSVVHVPQTIEGLLLGRIDRLPTHVRQTLREAAVIGPLFSETLLREIATGLAGAIGESLDALVAAGLLSPVPATVGAAPEGREFGFRHGLFQEVAYQTLLLSRRSELHTRIGEGLERLYGGAPRNLEELQSLAHHFRLGTDLVRAVRYLMAGRRLGRNTYANTDAIRYYGFALDVLAGAADRRNRGSWCRAAGRRAGPRGPLGGSDAAAGSGARRPCALGRRHLAGARVAQGRRPALGGGAARRSAAVPGRGPGTHGPRASARRARLALPEDGRAGLPQRRQRAALEWTRARAGNRPKVRLPAGEEAPAAPRWRWPSTSWASRWRGRPAG
jgi:hypothetical protein